tara:strand:- start:7925 stop:8236 length:312 start_codon:yes stop_codon:yes gene_type:complete
VGVNSRLVTFFTTVITVPTERNRASSTAGIASAPASRYFSWNDGKRLFALDSNGNTHVIAAGDELNVVAVNKLDQQAWGTPPIADGSIFIRTVDNLYRIAASR